MNLPEAFLREMKELLGEEYEDWLACQADTGGSRGLRVNTRKISAEEFQKSSPFPLRPVPWTPKGFYLDGEEKASRHPYYAAGLYYLQEPSAMTPAACLPVEEGDRVLDLCAAPGGKATELAAKLRGTGLLVANDVSNSRAKALLKNLELFGAGNILVTSETPEKLGRYFEGWFDKILIDAPCSGEGMFRKEPSMTRDWEEKGPAYYGKIQREIVSQAARLLRPGGLLLYSTCTFSVRENERTLLALLREEPGFSVLPLPVWPEGFCPGRPDLLEKLLLEEGAREGAPLTETEREMLKRAARLYPHRIGGEGHFVALLKKNGGDSREDSAPLKNGVSRSKTPIPAQWNEFAKLLRCPPEEACLRLYDGRLYALPEALLAKNIRGLRFLRTGLYLGDVKEKRFEPSQALAMALTKEDYTLCLDLKAEDERILRYLKGETLDVEEETAALTKKGGWCLVCVDGFPLGFGKLLNGTLKNKYYPGWRW